MAGVHGADDKERRSLAEFTNIAGAHADPHSAHSQGEIIITQYLIQKHSIFPIHTISYQYIFFKCLVIPRPIGKIEATS